MKCAQMGLIYVAFMSSVLDEMVITLQCYRNKGLKLL